MSRSEAELRFGASSVGFQNLFLISRSPLTDMGSKDMKPEKAMSPHSNTLAWKIPWAEETGRLQFMGSRRVGHDCVTSLSLFTFMHWRRKWQPTPVFSPGEIQGRGSLVGCPLWGLTESDMTEATQQLAYRVIVNIFLNSIYMHMYTVLVLFFLTYFTLYNRLQFLQPHQN